MLCVVVVAVAVVAVVAVGGVKLVVFVVVAVVAAGFMVATVAGCGWCVLLMWLRLLWVAVLFNLKSLFISLFT